MLTVIAEPPLDADHRLKLLSILTTLSVKGHKLEVSLGREPVEADDISDEFLDAIVTAVGYTSHAWDMVPSRELIAAIINQYKKEGI